MMTTSLPRATYRLQLNKDFTFADAQALVPHLATLGISHAYLSPILKARPGSTHGYDTVDHRQINPELGSIDDFRALAQALRQEGIGIILDFVPNHMGVGGADNDLWLDVLHKGAASPYANWFDIDWSQGDGKLMVPFLGASYAETLAAGDITLKSEGNALSVWVYDTEKLPLRSETLEGLQARYNGHEAAIAALTGTAGQPGSWAALDAVISSQHWLLVHHSVAADEINYRRFFINSDLAGIRIDRPAVFDHAHQLIFALIAEGLVDGLRIDHVDGLLDPKGYLEELQAKTPKPIYLLIEKILAPHERLRRDWPVDGTTGYEFGALLTRVLIDPAAEAAVTDSYRRFVGDVPAPALEAYQCKLRVMDNELAAELAALARRCAKLAWSVPATRDLTENGLRKGLREIIAQLEVYRPYGDATGLAARDRRELALAIGKARRTRPFYVPAVFDFLAALLLGDLAKDYNPAAVAEAVGRFQQYTGPVMAKGLEDTALYRYNRLVSLNEVGAHPDRFSIGIAAFHDANARRLAEHPGLMLATSTHDTKRGEDTRAVISAIADHPDLWDQAVTDWRQDLERLGGDTIHPNDLYLFFQLLFGGWPHAGAAADLGDRIEGAMVKALREGRQRSDWGVNNSDYETEVGRFIHAVLADQAFMTRFHAARAPLAETGRRKGLIQAALKLTVPGVPDIYRGAEDWEQSFVDPDNRRAVDFAALSRRLATPEGIADDKLVLTQTLLRLRQRAPDLFAAGTYEPLASIGRVLAFRRQHGAAQLVVIADLSVGHRGQLDPAPWLTTQVNDVLSGVAHSDGAMTSLQRFGVAVLTTPGL